MVQQFIPRKVRCSTDFIFRY